MYVKNDNLIPPQMLTETQTVKEKNRPKTDTAIEIVQGKLGAGR